ncbi:hypothetical protein BRADI_4g17418v3 [Brachypodium distachyon]|uniref:Uncharacterized protein n=1 Tax=Brachypodium distachyon TaxID=15368 RepID=A0A2K2CNG6_BRADI|nr:hypothetical protein BRADI_4g17418v3 [Brachypodium distachyon]
MHIFLNYLIFVSVPGDPRTNFPHYQIMSHADIFWSYFALFSFDGNCSNESMFLWYHYFKLIFVICDASEL